MKESDVNICWWLVWGKRFEEEAKGTSRELKRYKTVFWLSQSIAFSNLEIIDIGEY